MSRAATSPELALYRTPGQGSILRAAIYHPNTVYTAQVNQVFTTTDQVLEITYDNGVGDLADVLPDMTVLIGSTAGAHDKGICRLRDKDLTKFYIGETADISWANDLHITIIDAFELWARHVLIDDGTPYMDGGVAYSDQHANPDPTPRMGGSRVLKLTDATVSATYDFSNSGVIDGSAITGYATTSPTASGGSGLDTATPTLEWDAVGWHLVYLTLTAANGKSYFGVRCVYIWDDDNLPARAELIEPGSQDVETGGWEYSIALYDNADLSDVRDHSLVILFAEDYYGDTKQEIGSLAGCENIECEGWIAGEKINMNPEQGLVEFTIYTAHYWFGRIPSYPDGVEFVTGSPASWTEMQNLTVDKGLWHFLHWRTTATRIMDVFFSGDTKYTKEVSSLASNLWEQIREMASDQIFARAGVNRHNQLFVQVHPLLMPTASRSSIPTVMELLKGDYAGGIEFDRITMPEVAVLSLSGVAVNSAGTGEPFFSLSPGHTYGHYGQPESVDNLLVSSQSQANTLAGLYRSWRNNPMPNIPIKLLSNNRLIECFPNQRCEIDIDAADNIRGHAYDGYIYPVSVSRVFDPESGFMHTEVVFEAETAESLSINGDIPGSGDRSTPPVPSFPDFPPFPPIIPGGIPTSENGAVSVILHDTTYGFVYTTNFDSSNPSWSLMNGGLTAAQKQLATLLVVCPNGALYCGRGGGGTPVEDFIAYAPSLGATWQIIEDPTSIQAVYGSSGGVAALAENPLLAESVAYIIGEHHNHDIFTGTAGVFSQGVHISNILNTDATMSYGFGKWRVTGATTSGDFNKHYWLISLDGSAISAEGGLSSDIDIGSNPQHLQAGSLPVAWMRSRTSDNLYKFANNFQDTPTTLVQSANTFLLLRGDADITGQYLMAPWNGKGISADGGASWSALPNLPVGTWYFRNGGSPARWIAVSGSAVRATYDGGDSWLNKEGNITASAPVPAINIIRVVGY